eukprot:6186551-Pleurochrysis_carterae.AAC.1
MTLEFAGGCELGVPVREMPLHQSETYVRWRPERSQIKEVGSSKDSTNRSATLNECSRWEPSIGRETRLI